ncbi:MAG TPA: aminopeptidase P family protein [Planctomycetota bacterium]|nr:aminopeptidase P family protein [Planctomycetota bacterium]
MSIYRQRLERLFTHAAEAGLAGVALCPGPNLYYMCGLSAHLSERPTLLILPLKGTPAVVLPQMERAKIERAPFTIDIFAYDDATGPAAAFKQALSSVDMKGKALGIEARRIRFLELDLLANSGNAPKPQACDAVLAKLRMKKDAAELALMKESIRIAETAYKNTLPALRPGTSEREVAAEIVMQLLKAGADVELPFAPIIAAGANGSFPHAIPGDRKLATGEFVTVDWGAFYKGYVSDLTRTVAVAAAEPQSELRRAYEAVLAANAAGRAAAKPGATGQDVDRAARKVITDAGFGQFFTHRTGHGLGLETHEEPDMKEGSLIPLEPGMTFTVEPGVYIPGSGGIRIEDDVVITETGSETMTNLPREL